MVDEPTASPDAWIAAFAEGLDQPTPTPEEIDALLELAGVAAHASARTAAPIACYLVGRAGVSLDEAARAAAAVALPPA